MPSALRAMLAETRQQELIRKAERERQAAGASGAAQLLRRMHERLVALCRGPLMSSRTNDVVLGDGSSIHIRPLRVEDRAMYERAVCGLSPRSRYLRFAAPMPRISERLLDQMMRFDGARHVVYAALSADEGTIVGVVRYVRTPDDRSAEVAIAVADAWQGRGVGQELLARLIEHARHADLDSLLATILSENVGSVRLAGDAGFSFVCRSGTSAEYEMCLAST